MNAPRRTAAIAAASGLLLGLTGCSSTDDKPKEPISAPKPVKIIEPKVGSGHRFDDLIKATFEGMDKVDIANFQGTRNELAYAMFGRANHFTVVGIGFDDDAAEFCFRDIVHDTWFASHAQPSKARVVFVAGDGDECSLIPEEAAAITELADDEMKHVKGPKVVTTLIKGLLRAPAPAA